MVCGQSRTCPEKAQGILHGQQGKADSLYDRVDKEESRKEASGAEKGCRQDSREEEAGCGLLRGAQGESPAFLRKGGNLERQHIHAIAKAAHTRLCGNGYKLNIYII